MKNKDVKLKLTIFISNKSFRIVYVPPLPDVNFVMNEAVRWTEFLDVIRKIEETTGKGTFSLSVGAADHNDDRTVIEIITEFGEERRHRLVESCIQSLLATHDPNKDKAVSISVCEVE